MQSPQRGKIREPNCRNETHDHELDGPPRVSSEELIELLVANGARILASRYYGVLFKSNHKLIFVRRARVMEPNALDDILQAANIGPGRFDRLLSDLRLAASNVQ